MRLPILLPLAAVSLFAQTPSWQLIGDYQRFSLRNAVVPDHAVHADNVGNLYVAGYVLGALDPSQTSSGDYDAFLTKYDVSGKQLWAVQFGSAQADLGLAVTSDSNGNVYVAGSTFGSMNGATNAGGADAFVAEFDRNGNQLWIEQIGSSKGDTALAVVVDANGLVTVAGTTLGAIASSATNTGETDVFLVQYDQSGNQQWVQQFGSTGYDEPLGMAVDSSNNIYIAGYTSGALGGATNAGSYDAFLAQYSSSGTQQWIEQIGSAGADSAYAVTVDGSGNIYVAGTTTGTIGADPYIAGYDAFVAQYSTSGAQNWIRQFGTGGDDVAYAVGTDNTGTVYVAGTTSGTLSPAIPNAGEGDAFWATFDASGNTLKTFQFGSQGWDAATSIAFFGNGSMYVGGYTQGAIIPNGTGVAFLMTYAPAR